MSSREKCLKEKEVALILDVAVWIFVVSSWAGLGWLYGEMRKQDKRIREINDTIVEANHNLQRSVIQSVALSIALWQTGGRGVMQVKVPLPPDGSSRKVVTVSVTTNAVVVSSPGEKEFVLKMGE